MNQIRYTALRLLRQILKVQILTLAILSAMNNSRMSVKLVKSSSCPSFGVVLWSSPWRNRISCFFLCQMVDWLAGEHFLNYLGGLHRLTLWKPMLSTPFRQTLCIEPAPMVATFFWMFCWLVSRWGKSIFCAGRYALLAAINVSGPKPAGNLNINERSLAVIYSGLLQVCFFIFSIVSYTSRLQNTQTFHFIFHSWTAGRLFSWKKSR